MADTTNTASDIHIFDRSRAEFTGVVEVVSFSDVNVTLKCRFGTLSVDGEGMKVTSFDSSSGKLFVEGTVDSLIYYGDEEKRRRRLFG